ncbi:MAG: DUF1552 domain-containing protein [Deltaproteobacteria bacterium]|nr:DUF1552 domain-containing protein [Deltaproteobacteria bacterium]
MKRSLISAVNRRSILSALGAGLSSTFLPSLSKRADAAAAPRRIFFITSTHQVVPSHWRMSLGRPEGQSWSVPLSDVPGGTFSPVLNHFAPLKDKVMFIDGMSQYTGLVDGFTNNHDVAASVLLTGAGIEKNNIKMVLGRSVDQAIADALATPGRLRSIELGTHSYQGGFVAAGREKKLPTINATDKAFSTLFSDLKPSGPSSAAGGEREKIVAARAETMGAVKEQIAAISPKLSTSDRERLASHLDLVSAYQSRLAAGGASSCSSLPTMGGTYKKNVEDFNVEFGRLVAHAFACDVTRVASLQMADFVPESFGASGSVHDAMAHNNGNESGSGAQNLKKYNLAVAATVGRIAAEFSRLGLLDSTLIVWMSEHGLFVEPHMLEEMPVVVIGNVGGHFKTGRYISVARTEKSPRGKVVGRPHNLFLVSLMQAMGLPDNFLNVKTWYNTNVSGPLPDLV